MSLYLQVKGKGKELQLQAAPTYILGFHVHSIKDVIRPIKQVIP